MKTIEMAYEMATTLREMDVNAAGIRGALKKKGYSDEMIAEAVPAEKKAGFANDFYEWLAESERSESEVNDYILMPRPGKMDKNGKTNIERHLSHYSNIADLARKIWNV